MTWVAAELLRHRIQMVTSDAFAVGPSPPEALRVCLGGACSRDEIRQVLTTVADVLQQAPEAASPV